MGEKYAFKGENFINPYNFVSLGKVSRKNVLEYKTGILHTGVLECKLITKTPLAIPGDKIYDEEIITKSFNKKKNEEESKKDYHPHYDFYRIDGKACIPASSLRGPIRSVYETITNSCFSTAKTNQALTIRSGSANKPALLVFENGEYTLYDAERYLIKVASKGYVPFDYDNGCCETKKIEELKNIGYGEKVYFDDALDSKNERVKYVKKIKTKEVTKTIDGEIKTEIVTKTIDVGYYVKKGSLENKQNTHTREGYLYVGEAFSRKHFESVFVKTENKVTLDKSVIDGLKETLQVYNDSSVNKNAKADDIYNYRFYKELNDEIKKLLKRNESVTVPVWYDEKDKKLTAACIGRKSFTNNMGDVLGEEYSPCTSRESVCPACALFGTKDNGGNVRITDAFLIGDYNSSLYKKQKDVALRELGGPKISYLPFYVDTKNSNKIENWSYDSSETTIKGRKYYWHNTKDYFLAPEEFYAYERKKRIQKTKRNASMPLIDKGHEFTFKVYYDQISDQQLEQLKWCLTLGENTKDSSLCYKIGHGKPIGLGSSKIIITKQTERTVDGSYSLDTNDRVIVTDVFDDTQVKKDLLLISNMNTTKNVVVKYPEVKSKDKRDYGNKTASHQWFTNNYKFGKAPASVLPKLKDAVNKPLATLVYDPDEDKKK